MAKVTEYPRITKMKANDILLVDGPDGTRTILKSNAAKELGGDIIAVTKSGGKDKVTLNLTDSPIDLATEKDLDDVANALLPIGTASGNPAIVTDAKLGTTFKRLKVAIKPVQAGSGDPAPDNVRPISGWDTVKVTRCGGKNIFDQSKMKDQSTWNIIPIYASPGTVLTMSTTDQVHLGASGLMTYFRYPDGAQTTERIVQIGHPVVLVVPDAGYVEVCQRNRDNISSVTNYHYQIEIGSAATEYEPYVGNVSEVELPSEAGTVYGGELDLMAGTLKVDRANIASYNGESLPGEWISSMDVYSAGATPTTGAQVVYELSNPVVYNLTPVQIEALEGYNAVFADSWSVELAYVKDVKVEEMIAEESDSTASRAFTAGEYVIVNDKLDKLYKVTTDVSSGTALVPGTNIEETTVGEELTEIRGDVSEIGADVSELKIQLNEISTHVTVEGKNMLDMSAMTHDAYLYNDTVYSPASYWYTDFIAVEPGETYSFQTQTNALETSRANREIRFVCEYGANKEYIRSTQNTSASNGFTVPNDVYYIRASMPDAYFTNASTTKPAFVAGLTVIPYEAYFDPYTEYSAKAVLYDKSQILTDQEKETARNNIGVPEIEKIECVNLETIPFTWTDGYYLNGSGTPVVNSSYSYSNLFEVNSGDKILGRLRMITAYNSEQTALSDEFEQNLSEYVVPSGVKYIAVSVETAAKNGNYSIIITTNAYKSDIDSLIVSNAMRGMNSIKTTGQIDSTHTLTLNAIVSRKGFAIDFYGIITSFDTIEIFNGANSEGIKITTTDLEYYRSGNLYTTYQHSLSIDGFIYVSIIIDGETNMPKFTIYTKNGNYSTTPQAIWWGSVATIRAKTDNSILSDCELSFYSGDVKKSIWYVGDSYMTPGDQSRIPYWLIDSYKSICSMGFSGASATDVVGTLNLLNKGGNYPSYIIWAIGMNNGDTSTEINAIWKSFTDALIDVCDTHNVEIILCTIPNTPSVNNKFKNEYVRNSGKRYIDYASAVNTSIDGTEWIAGTLSVDNVHPTAEGAKRLASKLMTEFPEITNA